MEKINVYDDGKIGRGINATIIKARSRQLLIKFYDDFTGRELTVWFTKVRRESGGSYENAETNCWFYPSRETDKFKSYCREWMRAEYYSFLFDSQPI